MPKILMGWELGGGLGHVARLLPIGRALRDCGHEVSLAIKDTNALAKLADPDEFPWLKAPPAKVVKRKSAEPFSAGSYADILAVRGFDHEEHLFDTLQKWDTVLDSVRPDLIICEHAPALSLAAFGNVQVVQVGTGFTCPPTDADQFPPLGEDVESVDQVAMLQVVNSVQQRRDATRLTRLTEVLGTDRHFVMTWPELDPYQALRREPAIGPVEPLPATSHAGLRSKVTKSSFFAYLSAEMPGVGQVMVALKRSGFHGRTYFRNATAEQVARLKQDGIVVDLQPPDTSDMLRSAAVVVHHGGAGVSAQAVAAGCPQILLPRFVEQKLTGDCIESLAVGASFHGQVRLSSVISAAKRLSAPSEQSHALAVASRTSACRRTEFSPLQQVVKHCQVLLADF